MHKLASMFQQGEDRIVEEKLTLIADKTSSPGVNKTDTMSHVKHKKLPTSQRVIKNFTPSPMTKKDKVFKS